MEIAIIILVIVCVALLGREWKHHEKRVRDMEKRIEELEAMSRQRLPYKALDEILNAMAALDKEKTEMEFNASLIDNAMGHLANAMKVGTTKEKK